ncbi:MAG: hypothetical protein DWI22_23200 [Planctomycetota bacterium]|nr:MAG: hypothetical protein DWI22_23200 [Planctomycetota bacterium]
MNVSQPGMDWSQFPADSAVTREVSILGSRVLYMPSYSDLRVTPTPSQLTATVYDRGEPSFAHRSQQ